MPLLHLPAPVGLLFLLQGALAIFSDFSVIQSSFSPLPIWNAEEEWLVAEAVTVYGSTCPREVTIQQGTHLWGQLFAVPP